MRPQFRPSETQGVAIPGSSTLVAARLGAVQDRIARAESLSGRAAGSVTLVAVSKRKPAGDIVAAYRAGQRDFGENYVQEFEAKAAKMPDMPEARFHLIGHLQGNKAKRAARLFSAIHTVDSVKLATRLGRCDETLEVFLELKLSEEATKSGMEPHLLEPVLEAVYSAPNLRLSGLMTMPPWTEDPELARPYFRKLRELADVHGIAGLSMGMSRDLEVAIEEGATHVRVGTAIFGERAPRGR